ncbi:MAG: DUF2934 domain-containing protein [Candidatus Obscuribacterales bacterium]|nr:DUF2934 domain-containing protein [Candidatus Obscuribacterales bacterium]
MSVKTEIKAFSDIVSQCIHDYMDPFVLKAFREFLRKNGDKEWLIVSDYHVDKAAQFENYVQVFTILPCDEQHWITWEHMNAGLPTKLSNSSVTDKDIEFLRKLNQFTFIFVSKKNFRPAAPTAELVRASIDESINHMRQWTNADDCTDVINFFRRLREDANAKSFNLKLFNQATLSASCVSAIALEMLETISIKTIGWLSDRDPMIENFDGLVYQLFNLNMMAFCQQRKLKPFYLMWFGEGQPEKANEKRKPLSLAPYIRIPDYLAAPIASSELTSEGVQHLSNEKYQRILVFVIANNPNIAVLRLVNDPGWSIIRIKVNLPPQTWDIAKLAYRLWEERGFIHGNDLQDWLDAERFLVNDNDN